MLKLKNNRLEIALESPGEGYQGSRYDWSSFITQIILDEKYNFAGVESQKTGNGQGGKGLCGEFCMHHPLGYQETPVGGFFPKIGVGLVKRVTDQEYLFSIPVDYKPITWGTRTEKDKLTLSCRQDPYNGYAYKLYKKIYLKENELIIDFELQNNGKKTISTSEYNHNFLCFNKTPTGEDYSLSVNIDLKFNKKTPHINFKNRIFSFDNKIQRAFFCEDTKSCIGKIGTWQLTNKKLGLQVKETLSAPICKFALYGRSHTICPELFVDINVAPNKTFSWQRKWTFERLPVDSNLKKPLIENDSFLNLEKVI